MQNTSNLLQNIMQQKHNASNELIHSTLFGYMWMNISSHKLEVSDTIYLMLDKEPPAEPLSPEQWQSFVHPNDLSKLLKAEEKLMHTGNPTSAEYRLITATGRHIFILHNMLLSGSGIRGKKVMSFLQDITPQKNAEIILKTMNENFFELDANLIFKRINDHALKFWQLRKTVTGEKLTAIFPEIEETPFHLLLLKAKNERTSLAQDIIDPVTNRWIHLSVTSYSDSLIVIFHDIQNEKESENKLLKQIDLLNKSHSILNTINEACYELDQNGIVLFVNRQALEWWSLKEENVIGKNIWAVFPEYIPTHYYNAIQLSALNKKEFSEYSYESPLLKKWITLSATPTPTGCIVSFRKIDEIKKAEETIRQEHRRLTEAESIGHIGSFEWDIITDKISWSDEMYRIHGLKKGEEITLEKLFSLVHPDDLPELKEKKLSCKLKPCKINIIHRLLRPDGEVRIVSRHLQSFSGRDGKIARITGSVRDITEQKKAQLEIIRLKDELVLKAIEKYYSLFNSISQGFCTIEIIWNDKKEAVDYRFLEVNNAFEKLTGIENPVGKTILEIAPGHEAEWFTHYGQVAKTGIPHHFEQKAEALKGSWFDVYAFPIEHESGKIAVLFDDITVRKKAEGRQAYMLKLSDALRPLSNPIEIQSAAVHVIGELLQTDRAMYSDVEPNGDAYIINDSYVSEGTQKMKGRFPLASFGSATAILKKGENVIINDVNLESYDETEKKNFLALNIHAAVGVPLLKDGHLVAVLSVHQLRPRKWTDDDITLLYETAERTWAAVEKAKAEDALRKKEAELDAIINETPFMMTRCTRDLRYRYVSRAYAKMLNRKPEEINGRPIKEIMNERGWKTILPRIEHVLQGERIEFEDEIDVLGTGKPSCLHVAYTPDIDEESNVIGWFASFVDITERKRAEEALHLYEENYRLRLQNEVEERTREVNEKTHFISRMTDVMPDLLSVIDLSTRKVTYINKDLLLEMGFEDLDKMTVEERTEIIHPDDRLLVKDYFGAFATASDDDIIEAEYRAKIRTGEWRWFHARGKVFARDESGKATHCVNVVQNIDKRKAAERQIEHLNNNLLVNNKQLELLNTELRTFNSLAANNYADTLRHIYINLETIATTDARNLSNSSRANIRRAQAAAQKMKLLTNDINNYLKLYEIKVQKEVVDPNFLLQNVIGSMKNKLEDANAAIEVTKLPSLVADAALFSKLMQSLIDNAIKFSDPSKKPLVKIYTLNPTELLEIPEEVKDIPFTCIVVTDNGIGFESSEIIFELFRQLQDQNKNKGSGMGLSVCKKIMGLHGGTITAEGRPGEGATFNCFFPS